MLKARSTRVHRHTKPSAYMDRSRQARQQRAQRPGSSGFSFTGEFPEVMDPTPVEAAQRRRNYIGDAVDTGAYRAVGSEDAARVSAFSRYGVQGRTAVILGALLLVVMCSALLLSCGQSAAVAKRNSDHLARIEQLEKANSDVERQIAKKASDVTISIRQRAVLIGLVDSRGVDVTYLTAPETPDIAPAANAAVQMLIASGGQ